MTVSSKEVILHNKRFSEFLPLNQIQDKVKDMSNWLETKFKDETPIFLGILNGCVLFFAEVLKNYNGPCETHFIKYTSYQGTASTGKINKQIKISDQLKGRHIVILEDIIDTGNTISAILDDLNELGVKSTTIVTLLFKPDAIQVDLPIDLVGFDIPDKFVVGFGLDFDGLGRNINGIYSLVE